MPSASSLLLLIWMMCPARAHRSLSTAEERKGHEFCFYASAQSGCSALVIDGDAEDSTPVIDGDAEDHAHFEDMGVHARVEDMGVEGGICSERSNT